MSLRLGILGSMRGTAMQGLVRAIREGELDAEIALVISNKPEAEILERAERWNLPHVFLDPAETKRVEFDAEVTATLEAARVELVLMIGYMRIVSVEFVEHWHGRLLNVHPSLLPLFGGGMNRKVHEAVLASGVKETGCTIHHVTEDVDAGPILLQKRCNVFLEDTVETLKDRVQALEQEAFVEIVRRWTSR